MKRKEGIYHKKIIYSLEFLQSSEIEEDYINQILDSFNLSLIIGMHRFIGDDRFCAKIIKECKTDDNWFEKKTWSLQQFNEFKTILKHIYRNVYYYGENKCEAYADMWLNNYGFKIK